MQDLATLCDLAEAEIAALEGDGFSLTPQDVVELNALAWQVNSPTHRISLSRGRPVCCGPVYFWPLTIVALTWLHDNEYDLTRITPHLGYALAHGSNDSGEMDTRGRDSDRAVRRWYARLPVTADQFNEAIRTLDREQSEFEMPVGPDDKSITIADFCLFLAQCCGESADFWESRCSYGYAKARLAVYYMQNQAEKRPCDSDPRIIAEALLGRKIEEIKKRGQSRG